METTTYLKMVVRWWWLVGAVAFVAGTTAYLVSLTLTPTYASTATLLVLNQQTPGMVLRADVETSVLQAGTFASLVTLTPILERASNEGGLNMSVSELRRQISIHNASRSQIIEITGTAETPARAQQITNAVAESFVSSPELQLAGGGSLINVVTPAGTVTEQVNFVNVIAPATASSTPIAPKPPLHAVLGAALGLLVGGLLAIGIEVVRERKHERSTLMPLQARSASLPRHDPAS